MNENITPELFEQIRYDQTLRRKLATLSHYWFFHIYFSNYIKFQTAQLHRELFSITENSAIQNAVIVAFRGSAKSTIMTLSYPIWAMIGKQQKKFIVILSQTQQQSRLILTNIKQELEQNELLLYDFGPFYEDADEWRANSLVIPQIGCRISAISTGESIRGIKHRENRPDLLVCDDVEDLQSVKTREGRDKIFTWLTGDVIPAGDRNTKTIIVGNLLHEDSLIMRLKKQIDEQKFAGIFKAYPLVDSNGTILWPGKYPTITEIEQERKKVGSEIAWQREFLLHLVPDEDQLVKREWIQYYKKFPKKDNTNFRYVATGVDLAISQKESADYTAMVSARVHGYNEKNRIYIHSNPVNQRLDYPQTLERLKFISKSIGDGYATKLFIESVGYQTAIIQQLTSEGYPAEEFKISGQDKRARLALTTHLIKNGNILFPDQGAEELIEQLIGFGIEKHDDLVDAFTVLILKIIENSTPEPKITIIDFGSPIRGLSGPFNNLPITRDMVW